MLGLHMPRHVSNFGLQPVYMLLLYQYLRSWSMLEVVGAMVDVNTDLIDTD